jgi:hypothetical protein
VEDARDATKGLVQHTREQHKKVLNFVPPRTHHHLRREDGILTSRDDEEEMECPVPLCAMTPQHTTLCASILLQALRPGTLFQ